jgi:3-hydroxyacyl-CoA dehydrogenase
MSRAVGIVGAGIVGRAWAITFARAGCSVTLWDPIQEAVSQALLTVETLLSDLEANGMLGRETAGSVSKRIRGAASMEDAISDVEHVQENAPENVDTKRKLFAELDAVAPPDAVIASSSSAILPSLFTRDLPGRARCLVAHPINPPYLIPAVEVVPAPWTDVSAVERTRDLMQAIGQAPLVMAREVEGFIMNRLQAALLQEAFRMVAEGVASVSDVDAGICKGIGLRWAFMGPFETINLNAPGGVADYAARYGDAMYRIAETQTTPLRWEGALLEGVAMDLDQRTPPDSRAERQLWRDRRLMALMRHLGEADAAIGT